MPEFTAWTVCLVHASTVIFANPSSASWSSALTLRDEFTAPKSTELPTAPDEPYPMSVPSADVMSRETPVESASGSFCSPRCQTPT